MKRFTLQLHRWYACQFLGDEFNASEMCCLSSSSVRVNKVDPLAMREFPDSFTIH